MLERKSALVVMLAVLIACVGVVNAEILDNGDFEDGGWGGYGTGSGSAFDGISYATGICVWYPNYAETGGVDDSKYMELNWDIDYATVTSPAGATLLGLWGGWASIYSPVIEIASAIDPNVDPAAVNFDLSFQANNLTVSPNPSNPVQFQVVFDFHNSPPPFSVWGGTWTEDDVIFEITDELAADPNNWLQFEFSDKPQAGTTYLTIWFMIPGWYAYSGDIVGIDNVSLTVSYDPCTSFAASDINKDCIVNLLDFSILSQQWLVDCAADPNDPACTIISNDPNDSCAE